MTEEPREGRASAPEKPPRGAQDGETPEAQPALDEASASLAEALHTSFRVLTFLIVVLLALFLARGFFIVQPDTKAIVLRFGRTDRGFVKDVGLHYALPYPIDSYEIIPVSLKKLEVNTFWPVTTEEQKEEGMKKDTPTPPPVPGAEGASMLTGDRNILEARWDITYRINRDESQAVIDYYKNIFQNVEEQNKEKSRTTRDEKGREVPAPVESNEDVLIRTAVQSAVVRQLGRSKVSEIYPQRTIDLSTIVRDDVRKTVESLHAGLVVEQVNLIDIRPPKDVKASFDEVLKAKQGAEEQKTKAEQERQTLLIAAAGDVGVKLGDEIEKWWAAKSSGNADDLKKDDASIRDLFSVAGGKVRTTIAEAKAYQITIEESAKGDSAQVASLAELLKSSPHEVKIFLDHARVDALQEVLSNCYEVFLFNPLANGKTRAELDLWLSRRAELMRAMKNAPETR